MDIYKKLAYINRMRKYLCVRHSITDNPIIYTYDFLQSLNIISAETRKKLQEMVSKVKVYTDKDNHYIMYINLVYKILKDREI